MIILDGKKASQGLVTDLKQKITQLKATGTLPTLAAILVGDDPASQIYLRSKKKRAAKLGVRLVTTKLPDATSTAELTTIIQKLNQDDHIHAIMLEMPLPAHINSQQAILAIDPRKDVDGVHPLNLGYLFSGHAHAIPNTPYGILKLLDHYHLSVKHQNVVVVGRSVVVGRPLAALLLNQDATVTIAHRFTTDLTKLTQQADILVTAVGQPNMISAEAIKPGAIVIDVGINRLANGKLAGDVDYASVARVARALTPVPGGVGPMTSLMLFYQTVQLARRQTNHG
ncbi:bifunctional 5,10-methylenetetrahydrofolate dehydrogenase/5,10-methenyltetrahydrofolate cyclohydrolase [Loigolactobacillus rennini]|uniref:Bifunctional protein FolD n=1 Tax=Loigolactobacillus rennini DSM 20253 TaxID=1423796 RepID=A0A0R2D6G8_9LACO|nr:tetrahydrofolate dehydrogenase/cyclohydrolase catalytic domain-containing protein [Loigolactobacillus rennini]KRM99527.1 bifunctional 5,10-methylene-tetrahydrofolate dehydrogenase 5,10-methylene-tetrahydrofolate cyclohydrolase [Loigolactobacillus rennini DSM 20253]